MSLKYLIFIFCFPICVFSQNITVDSQLFTPQQLIEDILVDSNCISNVQVTNFIGGDFGGVDQSYGYFNANGSSFPFEEGIVLSTGMLQSIPGPNSDLNSGFAPGWVGDNDLEEVLNDPSIFTLNATILEFSFESIASEVRFRYLFASEEYQENSNQTCVFSDAFGFLIREQGTEAYENIALVPDTDIPVAVTTVHPEIPGECDAINEFFFDAFNDPDDPNIPTDFNGQTTILEAKASIQPNVTYEVKLVIADAMDDILDSAVFLEAGSFQLGIDLGIDRTILGNNPVCFDDSITLSVDDPSATAFQWFQNGSLLPETSNELEVIENGFYEVIVTLGNGCEAFGEITIEFDEFPLVLTDSTLNQCDLNGDGLTQYNLLDAIDFIINGIEDIEITGFFLENPEINANATEITNPEIFNNTIPNQVIFVQGVNQLGCSDIASLTLTAGEQLIISSQEFCDDDENRFDGITTINLSTLTSLIQNEIPVNTIVSYYLNESDAILEINEIDTSFTNAIPFEDTIILRLSENDQCAFLSEITLEIIPPSLLSENEIVDYCIISFPETITIESGVTGNIDEFTYSWQLDNIELNIFTETIEVNEAGIYSVTVTNQNGCSSIREIEVQNIDPPTVIDIITEEVNDNNSTVTIITDGNGTYEYSIESEFGPFQSSSVFLNVSPGLYTVYVRDINGCGTDNLGFSVLGFPKFFTPNNDGFNDFWQIKGSSDIENPIADISIFDRFGKLLHSSQILDQGWNGEYNGVTLPINDYWYKVTLQDGRVFTGHISLLY